eukprot:1146594-Pleurochrysis_carterae.AAC.1
MSGQVHPTPWLLHIAPAASAGLTFMLYMALTYRGKDGGPFPIPWYSKHHLVTWISCAFCGLLALRLPVQLAVVIPLTSASPPLLSLGGAL